MKNSILVPIPDKNSIPGGRVIVYGTGYIYWITEAWWDSATKNAQDNRRCIGKQSPDNPDLMKPNKFYIEQLSSLFEERHTLTHNKILAGGVFIVALRAADKMGILTSLQRSYPDDWRRIFATCVYWIDAQTSTAQHFEDWFFDNYCGCYTPWDGAFFTRFFEALSKTGYQRDAYWTFFREEYEKRFPTSDDADGKRCRVVGCDGGNSNTTDRDNNLAGYGHAKDDKDLPIVGYMNFVDETTGITLYWEYCPGPLVDKTEFPYALEKAREIGYRYIHLMMDRGFITKPMIRKFTVLKKRHGLEFSAMVPSTFGFVGDIIADYKTTLRNNQEYYIPSESIFGMMIPDDYLEKHFPEYYLEGNALIHVCLFYDDLRAAKERTALNDKVSAQVMSLQEKKVYTKKLADSAGKYLIVEPCDLDPKTKRNFTVRRNTQAIQAASDDLGFFLIAGNGDVGPEYEIGIARNRDRNEKSFRQRKSFFDLTTPDTGTNDTFTGKMVVADIAQNIGEAMQYYARDYISRKRSETFGTVVRELHKIKILVNEDGNMRPAFPLTREQKDLLKCYGLDDLDVDKYVRSLRWGQEYNPIHNRAEIKQMERKQRTEAKRAARATEKKGTK